MGESENKTHKVVLKNGYIFLASFIIYNIGFFSSQNIINLSIYYISYYHNLYPEKNITVSPVYFSSAIYSFLSALLVAFSGIFEEKLGIRISLIISAIIEIGNSLLLKYYTNVPVYLVSCALVGMAEGISSIFLKFLCMFFPGQEGFVTGFTKPFMAAFTYGWFYIGEYIVNENATELQKGVDFYEREISENIIKMSPIMLISIAISLVLFLLVTIHINFEKTKKESKEINKKNKTEEELLLEDPNQKESKEVYLTNIKAIFKSSIYWKLFSLCILLTVQPNVLSMSYRVLCDRHSINLKVIKTNISIAGVLGAVISLFAGWLNDKFGMKVILIPIGFIFGTSGILYILTLYYSSEILFCFTIYLCNVFVSIVVTIVFPNLVKIFGLKYVMEIYGPLGIAMTLMAFLISGILSLFTMLFEPTNDLPYFIFIGVGALFAFISVFVSYTLDVKKFEYPNDNKSQIEHPSKLLDDMNSETN